MMVNNHNFYFSCTWGKPLNAIFFYFIFLRKSRLNTEDQTYADTRWNCQRWLSSRDGHCRRACTRCNLVPLCCVCSYTAACCARSSHTRWHGHYTCTWVGRGKVTDRSGAKGPPHNDRAHLLYVYTSCLPLCVTQTKQAQTCRKAVQTQSSDDVCWAYHWNALRLSSWCLCLYPACPLIQRQRVCSSTVPLQYAVLLTVFSSFNLW